MFRVRADARSGPILTMEEIDLTTARRLALVNAGLLKPEWSGLPRRASGRGEAAREAAHAIIRHFGYLQLDSIPITGARTHSIVLHSRLEGLDTSLGEELLRPGEPLFEYLAHAACWIPMELYPHYEFRRREKRVKSEYHDILDANPGLADAVLEQVREQGPTRTEDLAAGGVAGRWGTKPAKYAAAWLWSTGDLAIRERSAFRRVYDLPERVIPPEILLRRIPLRDALKEFVLSALRGHGWASERTILNTFWHTRRRREVGEALAELMEAGDISPCTLVDAVGNRLSGWIRTTDLETAARVRRLRPRPDVGVLLSPFDPVLWDRDRVRLLFGFEQVLEIYKPAAKRIYGYYVLPVLAGERLVARVDLKANRKAGTLAVLSRRFEGPSNPAAKQAVESALTRFARSVGLALA